MSKTSAWVVAEQEKRAARADGPDERDYRLEVALAALRQVTRSFNLIDARLEAWHALIRIDPSLLDEH